MRLDELVVLVTGGARGQGAAEARAFVDRGARVVVGDVLDEAGAGLVAELGASARYVHLDVTDERLWDDAVALAEAEFGPLTTLVNNAGVVHSALVTEESVEDFRRVVDVNLTGTFLGTRAVIPSLTKAGGGAIVNISSIAGLRGARSTPAYTSSKWGIRGITQVAAIELAPLGIRVNSVHPGIIDTEMLVSTGRTRGDVAAKWESQILLSRLGTAQDVAGLVVFLASANASYITGSEFVVDGGFLAAY